MNREEMINEVREKLSESPPSPWEAVVYPGSKPWNTPERGEWSVVCPHPDIPDRPEYRLNLATIGFGPKAKAIAELIATLRNAAPALLDEITSLKPRDEPVPNYQRYPHARCHNPNPHTTHTWGDPLHYCNGAPTSEETTPAAHIVYTPDQHRCHDEIEALDPTPVGTIAKCSCGTHYTKCYDQRDGPYWVTGWDPSR